MTSKTRESPRTSGPRTPRPRDARFVFDNGPLSAFALVGRLDLLGARYRNCAAWTIEVRDELRRGALRHAELRGVLEADWLPEPIRLTEPASLHETQLLRWSLGGGDADPLRHLGEAATVVAAKQLGATAVLDDRDARSLAVAHGVPLVGTVGILKATVDDNELRAAEAWQITTEMVDQGVRLPAWLDRQYFDT